jgi:GT2 family glycosyltransferase
MSDGLARHEVVTGPNSVDELNPPWLAASRGRSIESPIGTYFGLFPCVRGNNFGVTKRSWSIIGGMTEGYPAGEDTEFSMRCWFNDIEIVGLPESIVHYRYRSSARALFEQGFAYGAHRPRIARILRDAGKPTPARLSGWKSWLQLMAKTPTLTTRSGRATWMWIAGNRFGQVAGSISHRIVML